MAFDQISPPWYYGIGRSRCLRGWRGLALLVAAVVAVAIGAGWSWLASIGALSILVAALPCLTMCALGLCMQRVVGHGDRQDRPSGNSADLPDTDKTCCGEVTSKSPRRQVKES